VVGASGRLVLQQFALEPHSSDPSHEGRWPSRLPSRWGPSWPAASFRARAIAVPGHLALTKFIKTPSVAKEKRVKIVSFEAAENITYPLEEVVWDHHVVADDGFDLEVMLTAVEIRRDAGAVQRGGRGGISAERATPAGLALCHAFRYNYPKVVEPVIVVNVGARTTNLLFLEGERFYIPDAGAGRKLGDPDDFRGTADSTSPPPRRFKVQVLSGHSDLPPASPSRAAVHRAATNFCTRLQLEITRFRGQSSPAFRGRGRHGALSDRWRSLIEELPALLAEKLRLPAERYEAFKNVDIAADAGGRRRNSGARPGRSVGMATCLVVAGRRRRACCRPP